MRKQMVCGVLLIMVVLCGPFTWADVSPSMLGAWLDAAKEVGPSFNTMVNQEHQRRLMSLPVGVEPTLDNRIRNASEILTNRYLQAELIEKSPLADKLAGTPFDAASFLEMQDFLAVALLSLETPEELNVRRGMLPPEVLADPELAFINNPNPDVPMHPLMLAGPAVGARIVLDRIERARNMELPWGIREFLIANEDIVRQGVSELDVAASRLASYRSMAPAGTLPARTVTYRALVSNSSPHSLEPLGYTPSFVPNAPQSVVAAPGYRGVDIYVREPDNQMHHLTSSPLMDVSPQVSRSGEWLLFVSETLGTEGTLHLLRRGDDSPRVIHVNGMATHSGRFSPTSRAIVFCAGRGRQSEIYTLSLTSSDAQPVKLTDNGLQDAFPSFSPNGRQIVFSRTGDSPENMDLFVMNTDGSRVRRLTTNRGWERPIEFAPDGHSILYFRADDVTMANTQMGLYLIAINDDRPRQLAKDVSNALFMPDGNHVAYSTDPGDEEGESVMYLADTSGTITETLVKFPSTIHEPSVSADGRSIIFVGRGRNWTKSREISLAVAHVGTGNVEGYRVMNEPYSYLERVRLHPEPVERGKASQGLDALTNLDNLPILREETWLVGSDSHDRTGNNADGFGATFSYLYKDGDEYVVYEEDGPGCFYILRNINCEGTLRFYLNGATEPTYAFNQEQLFSGNVEPFIYPLVAPEATAHGCNWNYIPIPYENGIKITSDEMAPPKFHNYTGHRYLRAPDAVPFSLDYTPRETAARWADPAKYVPGDNEARLISGNVTLRPDEPMPLLNMPNEGAFRRVRFKLDGGLRAAADVVLRMYFDYEGYPQIDTPLSSFVAMGDARALDALNFHPEQWEGATGMVPGLVNTQSLYVGIDDDGWLYCYLPMPFWQHALVTLTNRDGTEPIKATYAFDYVASRYPDNAGYLYAQWRHVDHLRPGHDFVIADTRGTGHYLGCVVTFSSIYADSPTAWPGRSHLEGDSRFYIDDARHPFIAGTGTEEYFNWGWYSMMPHDQVFSYAQHGYPVHAMATQDHTVMYRFHIGDVVPFYRAFRFELEHGPDGRVPTDYSATAFYYQRPESGLAFTDELNVGNRESEKEHKYKASGKVKNVSDILAYEGSFQLPPTNNMPKDRDHAFSDTGREWSGSARFTMAISPDNAGVKLRRRSNNAFEAVVDRENNSFLKPGQTVQVYVDGERVGVWRCGPHNAAVAWLESDYEIPREFTSGKEQIEVRLEAEGDTRWDEYTYWAYSYTPQHWVAGSERLL